MRNLLIITQKVDEEDDLLGFFVSWIREFASNFDKIYIITLGKGKYNLPGNVFIYSLGKERGSSRIARFFNFYKFLFHIMPKVDAVFAHMSPIFVIASWPAAFIFRKKIVLWYLHRSVTLRLKIAEKLSYKIATAARESLKFNSKKIVETGHGIDIEKFKTKKNWAGDKLRILSVGRISPIKNFETLINALGILKKEGFNPNLNIIGRPIMSEDFSYQEYLKNLTAQLGLEKNTHFIGFVPYTAISSYYKEADFCVGPLPTGGIDKAMLEGMAAGCIVLTSNHAFEKYFGKHSGELIFSNADDLALKLKNSFLKSEIEKGEISEFLVKSVQQNHNLTNLINKISNLYDR